MRDLLRLASASLVIVMTVTPVAEACEEGRAAPARVEQVYPTADVLPENLLRFYIYFSEPMTREGIWDSVALLDESGGVVSGAFIENRFDLWSPGDTRLTVLFDPGRVKTGLVAHDRLGRALRPGKTYRLQIRESARTRDGCRLSRGFEKRFVATDADFEAPSLEEWQVRAPLADTQEPLHVVLDGPTDHVSMAYRIRVTDEAGAKVGGSLRLAGDEQEWIFTPSLPWGVGPYRIEVNTALEDIAGNRLTGLFDRPLGPEGYSTPATEVQTLNFSPRAH